MDRPPPEGGIKESSSWGTQRTQDVFYETRSPAFERGHSEEIPIERVSKWGEGGGADFTAVGELEKFKEVFRKSR